MSVYDDSDSVQVQWFLNTLQTPLLFKLMGYRISDTGYPDIRMSFFNLGIFHIQLWRLRGLHGCHLPASKQKRTDVSNLGPIIQSHEVTSHMYDSGHWSPCQVSGIMSCNCNYCDHLLNSKLPPTWAYSCTQLRNSNHLLINWVLMIKLNDDWDWDWLMIDESDSCKTCSQSIQQEHKADLSLPLLCNHALPFWNMALRQPRSQHIWPGLDSHCHDEWWVWILTVLTRVLTVWVLILNCSLLTLRNDDQLQKSGTCGWISGVTKKYDFSI